MGMTYLKFGTAVRCQPESDTYYEIYRIYDNVVS
jgi:hypothetical protein